MKTCAITGHRGVLGSSFIKNNPDIKYLKFKGDLSKKKDIHNIIKQNSFDFFFHFGAIVQTYKVKNNFNYAKKVNYVSTINLLKIFSIIKKKRIRNNINPQNNKFADINKIKSLGWKPKYNIYDILKSFKKK